MVKDNILAVTVPSGWHQLTQKQWERVCSILVDDNIPDEDKPLIVFLVLAGLKLCGYVDSGKIAVVEELRTGTRRDISTTDLAGGLDAVAWINEPPVIPCRPDRIAGRTPPDAELFDVPLKTYIEADNWYQGVVLTGEVSHLRSMASVLVPKAKKIKPWELRALLLWFISVKIYLQRLYPDLFPAGTGGREISAQEVRDACNSIIRLLSGGDVTKETAVLECDTHRALTELNAKAREFAEADKK